MVLHVTAALQLQCDLVSRRQNISMTTVLNTVIELNAIIAQYCINDPKLYFNMICLLLQ
jgi:hypothetical protein